MFQLISKINSGVQNRTDFWADVQHWETYENSATEWLHPQDLDYFAGQAFTALYAMRHRKKCEVC